MYNTGEILPRVQLKHLTISSSKGASSQKALLCSHTEYSRFGSLSINILYLSILISPRKGPRSLTCISAGPPTRARPGARSPHSTMLKSWGKTAKLLLPAKYLLSTTAQFTVSGIKLSDRCVPGASNLDVGGRRPTGPKCRDGIHPKCKGRWHRSAPKWGPKRRPTKFLHFSELGRAHVLSLTLTDKPIASPRSNWYDVPQPSSTKHLPLARLGSTPYTSV
jgi:hypothetical protein